MILNPNRFCAPYLFGCLALILLILACRGIEREETYLNIQVVDGINGDPVPDADVEVWLGDIWDNVYPSTRVVYGKTNSQGCLEATIPFSADTLGTQLLTLVCHSNIECSWSDFLVYNKYRLYCSHKQFANYCCGKRSDETPLMLYGAYNLSVELYPYGRLRLDLTKLFEERFGTEAFLVEFNCKGCIQEVYYGSDYPNRGITARAGVNTFSIKEVKDYDQRAWPLLYTDSVLIKACDSTTYVY